MDTKTVKLLNKCGYGKVVTYRTAVADNLIKLGMAEEIDSETAEKLKTEKKTAAKTNKDKKPKPRKPRTPKAKK